MTTTSRWLAFARKKLGAPLARFEESAWGLRAFERFSVPSPAALTVICDDGEAADLRVVEVLSNAGVRGVFAVSPALIGRPGFMTYEQLAQVRDLGHEVAFHGTTHEPFTRMRPSGRLQAVIDAGMKRLADEGFVITTLVYPYGANNCWVRAQVAPLFECAFTTWRGLNEQITNRYAVRRIPFGAYAGRKPPSEAWYRRCIERAASSSCWPTLMLHPGVPAHTPEHDAMLGRLLAHARECGVPVRTARQHLAETHARPLAAVQGAASHVAHPGGTA